jgi:branched-chain amino acid transport system substrate-binding protein
MRILCTLVLFAVLTAQTSFANVKIGLNYDKTGPYSTQGLDQYQAAQLAIEEINSKGGILGENIDLIVTDAAANAAQSVNNANDLIRNGVKMIFGGAASSVAIAVGEVANRAKVPFFGTLTYSTETTVEQGRKFVFRECYDSFAAASVLGNYIKKNLQKKKFFFITARYTWGYTTERSIRNISSTNDIQYHERVYTPFPDASDNDFKEAISKAIKANPDVLVLVLFGSDMVKAIHEARQQGFDHLKTIIVPNLTLGMAEDAGPDDMEGVIGAIPWMYQIPNKENMPRAKSFVDKFAAKYKRYPDTPGASAYTILYEYKAAVERAKSLDGLSVVNALEGQSYTLLKDKQYWREWDHQSIQSVYAVKVRKAGDIKKSKFKQDYFEIISKMNGAEAFISKAAWLSARKAANKPAILE